MVDEKVRGYRYIRIDSKTYTERDMQSESILAFVLFFIVSWKHSFSWKQNFLVNSNLILNH